MVFWKWIRYCCDGASDTAPQVQKKRRARLFRTRTFPEHVALRRTLSADAIDSYTGCEREYGRGHEHCT